MQIRDSELSAESIVKMKKKSNILKFIFSKVKKNWSTIFFNVLEEVVNNILSTVVAPELFFLTLQKTANQIIRKYAQNTPISRKTSKNSMSDVRN